MRAVIRKGGKKDSLIRIPASKSLLNRMILAAAAAEGTSVIRSVTYSNDILEMISVMEDLGAVIEKGQDSLQIRGFGGRPRLRTGDIWFSDSASALRFAVPLLSLTGEKVNLHTGKRLHQRGISVYEELFQERGLCLEGTADGWTLFGKLPAGDYEADGSLSSQYISGLLCALPLLEKDSRILVRNRFVSEPYARLTCSVLHRAGIDVRREGNIYTVKGRQAYHPFEADVPGDDSQAAFFAGLALLSGNRIHVPDMAHDSEQADHVILDLIRRFGGTVRQEADGYVFSGGPVRPAAADLTDCPDLGPVLFACAAAADGESVFTGASRLRRKESDRIGAMCEELRKFGCGTHEEDEVLRIRGKGRLESPCILDGHNDHRVVMALSVLAACSDQPVVITGAEAVNKSYPAFFDDLAKTGASVTRID
ncbi:MAG: 3-phosphoshikimate 1-carboxyvinyltransferase [Solobacterium sp.]|nr:3-phosphoshikimate 1-carboxyvinyltransferase [Solobacterium sp.]